jgi:hypothetical protein
LKEHLGRTGHSQLAAVNGTGCFLNIHRTVLARQQVLDDGPGKVLLTDGTLVPGKRSQCVKIPNTVLASNAMKTYVLTTDLIFVVL